MNLAQFLLRLDNEYNGHKQTEIKGLSVEDGMEICKLLEKEFDGNVSFTLEWWSDGCFTVWQKDELNDKDDKIILTSVK